MCCFRSLDRLSKRISFSNDYWKGSNTAPPLPPKGISYPYRYLTVPPVFVPPKLPFPDDKVNDNYALPPIQPLQYQPVFQPIMPQSNISASTNLKLFENLSDQSHKPELYLSDVSETTPENQAVPGSIFSKYILHTI